MFPNGTYNNDKAEKYSYYLYFFHMLSLHKRIPLPIIQMSYLYLLKAYRVSEYRVFFEDLSLPFTDVSPSYSVSL